MPNFTKMAIQDTFIKLLSEKPLNQISVKSIVDECGINRNTFYYHFQDIPALLESIAVEQADKLIHDHRSAESFDECLDVVMRHIRENRKALYHIYNSLSRDVFEDYLMRICDYTVTEYMRTLSSQRNIDERDRRILARFLRNFCFGMYMAWVRSGIDDGFIDEFARLKQLIHSAIESVGSTETDK